MTRRSRSHDLPGSVIGHLTGWLHHALCRPQTSDSRWLRRPPPDSPGVRAPPEGGMSGDRHESQSLSHRKINTPRDASAGVFGNPGMPDELTQMLTDGG